MANNADRCYHCKTELYSQLGKLSEQLAVAVVVNGANADDLGDYRPGMRAAAEHAVRSPLAECGFTKQEVRELAAAWELPVADKPATPCLSSRVAYGLEVTPERLAMIDRAEQFLRALGFRELRVRYHADDMARIEVPAEQLSELCEAEIRCGDRRGIRTARLQVRHARPGRVPLRRFHQADFQRDAEAVFLSDGRTIRRTRSASSADFRIPKGFHHSAQDCGAAAILGIGSSALTTTLKGLHQSQTYRSSYSISYRCRNARNSS